MRISIDLNPHRQSAVRVSHINVQLGGTVLPLRMADRLLLTTPTSLLGWLLLTSHRGKAHLYLDHFVVAEHMAGASV